LRFKITRRERGGSFLWGASSEKPHGVYDHENAIKRSSWTDDERQKESGEENVQKAKSLRDEQVQREKPGKNGELLAKGKSQAKVEITTCNQENGKKFPGERKLLFSATKEKGMGKSRRAASRRTEQTSKEKEKRRAWPQEDDYKGQRHFITKSRKCQKTKNKKK